MKIGGVVRVPGDKSLTHRLLLLGGLAPGRSELRGALTSLDAQSTGRILRQLGVEVSPLRSGAAVQIKGRRRFRPPGASARLHCGNSGTTARLLLGFLAAHPFPATLTGDRSLRRRPMRRVTDPLACMGAQFDGATSSRDGLPLTIRGGELHPLEWEMPVSSAQIKSALLFAGLAANVSVAVREPNGRSRDHTERLLTALGYDLTEDSVSGWIHFRPDRGAGALAPFDLTVPGDPSSAAFLVGAAVMADAGRLRIEGVGLNPTRTGYLRVLDRMGASVLTEEGSARLGEPVGDLVVEPSTLRGTIVAAGEIPGLIDEIPLLAVLAARATGTTVFHDVGELRVKESDRLQLLVENLTAVGLQAETKDNTLIVEGSSRTPRGPVVTEGDHRIAMAFAILGTVPGAKVHVDDMACAEVSFPRFLSTLQSIRTR